MIRVPYEISSHTHMISPAAARRSIVGPHGRGRSRCLANGSRGSTSPVHSQRELSCQSAGLIWHAHSVTKGESLTMSEVEAGKTEASLGSRLPLRSLEASS